MTSIAQRQRDGIRLMRTPVRSPMKATLSKCFEPPKIFFLGRSGCSLIACGFGDDFNMILMWGLFWHDFDDVLLTTCTCRSDEARKRRHNHPQIHTWFGRVLNVSERRYDDVIMTSFCLLGSHPSRLYQGLWILSVSSSEQKNCQ